MAGVIAEMPVRKESRVSSLRLSGLFIRRKSDREFHSYIPLLDYNSSDYEVLLRLWGSEPFPHHLGAFSGPLITGEDPQETLLKKSNDWTKDLANKAEISNYKPMKSHKALFLSMHGGEESKDPISGISTSIGIVLCYVLPIKQNDSSLISLLPDLPNYPKFFNFGIILHQMARSNVKIHPYTREMLSILDHWLREQHAVAGSINSLFARSLESRMKMFVVNPTFAMGSQADAPVPLGTPNQSLTHQLTPLISSTPFIGVGENSTRHETTGFTVSKIKEKDITVREHQPVDMIVENPIFGSGLRLKKVDMIVVNDCFFYGEPDYKALKEKKGGKWIVQVASDGLPDWTELFPMHKFCCEGNAEGVRQCIKMGMSADERDTDTWTPLHYASWYGELEVVKALIEEASATIGIQNSSGSTPLHLSAGTGHAAVVAYLLKQRGGHAVKAALDNEGKSPLAVCLDCKMNDWTKTAQILRDAYNSITPADVSFPPPLVPYSPPSSTMENLAVMSSSLPDQLNDQLGLKGSLGNLSDLKSSKRAGQKLKQQELKTNSIRRQKVNLGIGHHHVAHFFNGRETDCNDIITNLYKQIRLPRNFHTLFALWIASNNLELQMGDNDQPLKLIYAWKKMLSQYGVTTAQGKGEAELPALFLWRNVFFPPAAEKNITDPMALEFLYTNAHRHVVNSQYPCSEDDAFYLAGITLQIMFGDYNEEVHGVAFLKDKLARVLPSHMMASRRKVEYERKVLARYAGMSQFGFEDLKYLYLTYMKHCWQWPYYGATFYGGILHTKETKLEVKVKISRKSQLPVLVGINTEGFHLINSETNTLIGSVSLEGLDWDVSTAKQEMVIFNESRTTYILIHSRKVSLLYGVATRMREQHTKTA